MVEITTEEQNKVKEWKELRIILETSGTIANTQTFELQGTQQKNKKERVWENFWRVYSWKCPQKGKENSHSSPRGTKSSIQDKLKEKHAKTHTNPPNKNQTQRKNIKAIREKQQVTHKGNPILLKADLSAETLQARREWQDIFKILKGKNLQPRLLYLARISFTIGGEIKSFSDKQMLREFSTIKPTLQQILKGLI